MKTWKNSWKVAYNSTLKIFPLLPQATPMAQNWKSMLEIGLRHSLLYLLCEGKSGIVIGRYPGDHYAGGNPWQLLTAVLGETFYLGAQATLKSIEEKGVADFDLDKEEESREWIKLLDTYESKFFFKLPVKISSE